KCFCLAHFFPHPATLDRIRPSTLYKGLYRLYPPEQRMSRKTLMLVGVAIVLLFVILLAIPALIDVNHYRPQIQARLEEQLGRDVSLGPMHLSLLPPGFRVEEVVIAEGAEFQTGRPFAQAQLLYVQPKLFTLLRGDLQIHGFELSRP